MKEIEVRILDVDVSKIRKRLKQIGAKKVFEGRGHTNIFDFSDGLLKKKQQMLRLRTLGKQTVLCYKGKQNASKTFKCKEEIEVIVDSFENTVLLLQRLGFKKMWEYTKRRESYKIGNAVVEIDKYAQIPALIEIEAPTGKAVIAAVKKIGYEMKDTTNISFPEILKLYKIKK